MAKNKSESFEIDGVAVRAIREHLSETQAEFGDRFGVQQPAVHKWETNGIPGHGPTRVVFELFLKTVPGWKAAVWRAKKKLEFA